MDMGAEAKRPPEGELPVCPLQAPSENGNPWSPATPQTSPCRRVQSLTAPACRGLSIPLFKAGWVPPALLKMEWLIHTAAQIFSNVLSSEQQLDHIYPEARALYVIRYIVSLKRCIMA